MLGNNIEVDESQEEITKRIHLTKSVKVFKVCLVKSVPHYFNVHVIQVLEINKSHEQIHQRNKLIKYKHGVNIYKIQILQLNNNSTTINTTN